ncbi:MAG TPA: pyrimidine 5'-nucleotidase [Phenylobacterium sp.]
MSANLFRADLRHVDTWLFDLDNTLYPAESGFMSEVVDRMTDFVERVTGLPRDEAFRLQKTYLAEHGLTLKGMMLNHGVDPKDFHAIFHDVSLEALAHDPELLAALERLPGRRLIFTNADDVHAERVLRRLGLAHLFDDLFHIGSSGYEPKPSAEAFARMGAAHGIAPAATAFFEDSERNLAPAADLGMTTVLVGPHAAQSTAPFVHHRTEKLAPFLMDARLRETA